MQKKITITLNKIFFQDFINLDSILDILLKNPYNENDGMGFSKAEIFENVIEATLIKRTPTSIQEFDINSGDFIIRNIFIFDEISFNLDLENCLIYSSNSATKLNIVKQALKNYIEGRISYENLNLNPKKIIDALCLNNFEYQIREIVIRKFLYNRGALGRYNAKILDFQIGQTLMNEYLDEIERITLDIASAFYDNFSLTISTNNSISIKSSEDILDTLLEQIKNQII